MSAEHDNVTGVSTAAVRVGGQRRWNQQQHVRTPHLSILNLLGTTPRQRQPPTPSANDSHRASPHYIRLHGSEVHIHNQDPPD
jgi:hypothetical protein